MPINITAEKDYLLLPLVKDHLIQKTYLKHLITVANEYEYQVNFSGVVDNVTTVDKLIQLNNQTLQRWLTVLKIRLDTIVEGHLDPREQLSLYQQLVSQNVMKLLTHVDFNQNPKALTDTLDQSKHTNDISTNINLHQYNSIAYDTEGLLAEITLMTYDSYLMVKRGLAYQPWIIKSKLNRGVQK